MVDIPKIEVSLSDSEYLFLYGVMDDIMQSISTFKPAPISSEPLALPTPALIATTSTPNPSAILHAVSSKISLLAQVCIYLGKNLLLI